MIKAYKDALLHNIASRLSVFKKIPFYIKFVRLTTTQIKLSINIRPHLTHANMFLR